MAFEVQVYGSAMRKTMIGTLALASALTLAATSSASAVNAKQPDGNGFQPSQGTWITGIWSSYNFYPQPFPLAMKRDLKLSADGSKMSIDVKATCGKEHQGERLIFTRFIVEAYPNPATRASALNFLDVPCKGNEQTIHVDNIPVVYGVGGSGRNIWFADGSPENAFLWAVRTKVNGAGEWVDPVTSQVGAGENLADPNGQPFRVRGSSAFVSPCYFAGPETVCPKNGKP